MLLHYLYFLYIFSIFFILLEIYYKNVQFYIVSTEFEFLKTMCLLFYLLYLTARHLKSRKFCWI